MSIQVTKEEAEAIVRKAIEISPTSSGGISFDAFPELMQLQAIAGALNVIEGMQALGWTIERPKT